MVDQWNIGLDGNWHDGVNWSDGSPPTAASNVLIDKNGSYTISLTDATSISTLELNAAHATLSESATGSFNVTGTFNIDAGTVVLRGSANTFSAGVSISDEGTLRIAGAHALDGSLINALGGKVVFAVNETLDSVLNMANFVSIAAAHGKTLDFGSASWTLDSTSATVLSLGTQAADGTIVFRAQNGITAPGDFQIHLLGGTVREGDSAVSSVFSDASTLEVDSGATLDLAGFSTAVTAMRGAGIVRNSGALTSLEIDQNLNFTGTIKGAIAVELAGSQSFFGTAQTYTGGTTVDAADTLFLGGDGSVVGTIDDEGKLVFEHDDAFTVANTISGAGSVSYENGGTYTLHGPQSYSGGTLLFGSTVNIDNSAAFGSGPITMELSSVIAEAKVTLSPGSLELDLSNVFAEAHGKTLIVAPGSYTLNSLIEPMTLFFGDSNDDGTVVLSGGPVSIISGTDIDVRSGTLRAGNDTVLASLLDDGGTTTVAAGATLALGGFDATISDLTGKGRVTNFSGATTTLLAGNFAGIIAGKTVLAVEGPVVLTGNSAFTGKTTIDSGAELSLGNGGKTGSILGNIGDNGILSIDHSNAFVESAFISGTGQLVQRGTGTTTIDRGEAFSGGTSILAGVLSVDRSTAIGTGMLTLSGGKFLVTQNATFDNDLNLTGGTIAAATGTTATFTAASVGHFSSGTLVFGDAGHTGTIDWASNDTGTDATGTDFAIEVRAGTLKADGTGFEFFDFADNCTIDSGAKLNLGHQVFDDNISGGGTITGAADAELFMENGTFSGALNGAMSVHVLGNTTLSGQINTTGSVDILRGGRIVLDRATSHDIGFSVAVAGPAQDAHGEVVIVNDAVLVLTHSDSFTGTITGFANGATIDLRDFAFSGNITKHFNHNTDVLTLSDGTHIAHISFDADFAASDFKITHDSHGGTEIVAHFPVAPVPADPASFELG